MLNFLSAEDVVILIMLVIGYCVFALWIDQRREDAIYLEAYEKACAEEYRHNCDDDKCQPTEDEL